MKVIWVKIRLCLARKYEHPSLQKANKGDVESVGCTCATQEQQPKNCKFGKNLRRKSKV